MINGIRRADETTTHLPRRFASVDRSPADVAGQHLPCPEVAHPRDHEGHIEEESVYHALRFSLRDYPAGSMLA